MRNYQKYTLDDIEPLLANIDTASEKLMCESRTLRCWSEKLREDAEIRKSKVRANRKIKLEITNFVDETKEILSELRKQQSNEAVIVEVLKGSMKSGDVMMLIQKEKRKMA